MFRVGLKTLVLRGIGSSRRLCSMQGLTRMERSFTIRKYEPVLVHPATRTPDENYPLPNLDQGPTRMERSFKLTKYEPVLVHPATRTPDENYFLSNLDQVATVLSKFLFRFKADERKRNDNVVYVTKDALAKVLVEFYPYTGRITLDSQGKFIVKCTGEGVPFVEAYVEDEIEVLGDITILKPMLVNLVHCGDEEENMLEIPPLTVQVTRFKCGGFIIGVGLNHMMSDGGSFGEFMNSWAEVARGLTLTVPPFLDRTIIRPRQPAKIEFSHHEFAEEEYKASEITTIISDQILNWSFCFHPKALIRLKSVVCSDTSIKPPTNFELITAFMWRHRTKALKVKSEEKVKLNIVVSLRNKLNGFLPKGYFGNGIVFSCCQCNAHELLEKPLSFAVRLVQEAIESVTETYVQSYIDYFEVTRKDLAWENTFFISKVARLSLYDADFGWGVPTHVAPASVVFWEVHYLYQDKDSENIVLSLALPVSAMKIFQELIQSELS